MSLSDPSLNGGHRPPNPVGKLFLQWQGAEGYWYFYDKEVTNPDPKKKGTNINIGTNITFVVLDELHTVKGYNQKESKFIYSNEVRNTKTDIMEVFMGGDPLAKGIYKQIKDVVNAKEGDYVKSIYIAMKGPDGKLAVMNLSITGASLTPWIKFSNSNDLSKGCVKVTGFTNEVNGAVKFVAPVFQFIPLAPEQMQNAIDLDANILQPFLLEYFKFAPDASPLAAPVQQTANTQPPAQNAAPAQAAWGSAQNAAPVNNSLSNQPAPAAQTDFSMQPAAQPGPKDDGMGWGKPVENVTAPPAQTFATAPAQEDDLPF